MGDPNLITRHSWMDRLPRHRHREAYAAVVLAGGYVEAGDQGRMRVAAGHVLLHRAYEAHKNEFARAGAVVLNLQLPAADLPTLACCRDVDLLARLAARDPREASAALTDTLTPATAQLSDWPDLLARQLRSDPHLEIGRWAAQHRLAPQSVSRGFRAAYGISPQRFRLEARARRALLRLATWSGTLAGLAAEYGFADHAHLSRTLVSMTGIPPAAMRLRR